MDEDIYYNQGGYPREDPYGHAVGTADSRGVIDMGDGTFFATKDYKTIKLPEQFGGHFTPVIARTTVPFMGEVAVCYLLVGKVSVVVANNGFNWVSTESIQQFFDTEEE